MQEPVFRKLPPHGKTGVRSPGSGRAGVLRPNVKQTPTARQPNRGVTDDDPEFTCTVCTETLPMAEAHRVKTKEGQYRRTGWCVPCALAKQRSANDLQAAKRRGPDYVLPIIKDQAFPIVDGKRQCALCDKWKPIEDFYKNSTVKSGYDTTCVPCFLLRKRDAHLLRTYNLTPEKYEEMLASQDGVCAICGQAETVVRRGDRVPVLSVDHDHACCPGTKSCGRCVRQLLCHKCNVTIGAIERVGSVDPFAAYLARHAAPRTVVLSPGRVGVPVEAARALGAAGIARLNG